jgi:hypothetical protein
MRWSRRLSDIEYDSATGTHKPSTALRNFLDKDLSMYGTFLYVELMHRFASLFTLSPNPADAVRTAASVIALMGYWDVTVRKNAAPPASLDPKLNLLTRETQSDVIIACNAIILAIAWVREYCIAHEVSFFRCMSCKEQAHGVGQVLRDRAFSLMQASAAAGLVLLAGGPCCAARGAQRYTAVGPSGACCDHTEPRVCSN